MKDQVNEWIEYWLIQTSQANVSLKKISSKSNKQQAAVAAAALRKWEYVAAQKKNSNCCSLALPWATEPSSPRTSLPADASELHNTGNKTSSRGKRKLQMRRVRIQQNKWTAEPSCRIFHHKRVKSTQIDTKIKLQRIICYQFQLKTSKKMENLSPFSEISRKPYVENKLKKTSNSRCSSEGFDRGSH